MNQNQPPNGRSQVKQGFPDGYDFRNSTGYKNEEEKRSEKQQRAFRNLQDNLPENAIKGDPVDFNTLGQNQTQQSPQGQQAYQAQHGDPYANPQRPAKSAEEFFGKPQQPSQPQPQPSRQQRRAAESRQRKEMKTAEKAVEQTRRTIYANPTLPLNKQPKHPVVNKLLQQFGLKKTEKHDLEVFVEGSKENITYTMTVVPEDVSSWALKEAKNRGVLEGEQVAFVYFELLFSCCSVVAMDREPVWRIFNIEPEGNEIADLQEDPLDISSRIRKASGYQLAQLLWSETNPMGDKLLEFYQNKITERKITSSYEKELENTFKYICPLDGCDHFEVLPKVDEVQKDYFCRYHGVNLVEAVDLSKDEDLPLE